MAFLVEFGIERLFRSPRGVIGDHGDGADLCDGGADVVGIVGGISEYDVRFIGAK